MTADDYKILLIQLLPRGPFWDGMATLKKVLAAWACELERVHNRVLDLLREADPSKAVETLSDWERMLGLPDDCTITATDNVARQQAIVTKLISQGGQSIAYYTALAQAMGYGIAIDEFTPFTTESSVDDRIYDEAWATSWIVRVLSAPAGRYVGGRCLDLECVFARANQAHLELGFNYSALEV